MLVDATAGFKSGETAGDNGSGEPRATSPAIRPRIAAVIGTRRFNAILTLSCIPQASALANYDNEA